MLGLQPGWGYIDLNRELVSARNAPNIGFFDISISTQNI
jgi:hypothetical protein